jgi:hypothetical protein
MLCPTLTWVKAQHALQQRQRNRRHAWQLLLEWHSRHRPKAQLACS